MSIINRKNYLIVSPDPSGSGGLALNINFSQVGDDIEALQNGKAGLAGCTFTGQVIAPSFAGSGSALTNIPQSAVTGLAAELALTMPTNKADSYVTSGAGTLASPYLGWEATIPKGSVEIQFTPGFVYGVTSSAGLAIGVGQDDTRLIGHGATLKWWGSGTAQHLVSFTSPTNVANALEKCEFLGFDLDLAGSNAANQAINGLYARSAHHLKVDAAIVNAGTSGGDAFSFIACTSPYAPRLLCSKLVNAGASNMTRGLVVDGLLHGVYGYVQTSIGNFNCHANGTKSDTWFVNGVFDSNFSGSGENSAGGWGANVGTSAADLNFFGVDWEGSGPIGFNGSHSAVRVQAGAAHVNFIGSKSFDGYIQIDSGALGVTIVGGTWGGCTNQTTGGVSIIAAGGINPNVGSFGGEAHNVRILGRPENVDNVHPDLFGDCIIGTGTNGAWINYDQFGCMAIFNAAAGIGNIGTKYALNSTGSVTQLNGSTQSAVTVSNVPVVQAFNNHVDVAQPMSLPALATNATSPGTGYLARDISTGKLMRSTGGTNWVLIG